MNRMAALATPLSPLSFEAAMAMGQTGRFLSPTARPRHQSKPSDILNQNQDEEDWCWDNNNIHQQQQKNADKTKSRPEHQECPKQLLLLSFFSLKRCCNIFLATQQQQQFKIQSFSFSNNNNSKTNDEKRRRERHTTQKKGKSDPFLGFLLIVSPPHTHTHSHKRVTDSLQFQCKLLLHIWLGGV